MLRKQKHSELMKSYSGISGRSNSIEANRKSREKKKKTRQEMSYATNNLFSSSSNHVSKKLLRSGSNT